LRSAGADGYGGGIALFAALATVWGMGLCATVMAIASWSAWAALLLHGFLLYSFLALGDLLHHVWRIESAANAGDLPGARAAVSVLVGRDTDRMDAAACRRAAVESLSESLTDGYISPLFWYVIAGLPGLIVFKVVSTMDSMVGYKTPRYLQFGWCGARLDDVMNYVPARIAWLLVAGLAAAAPGFSGRKAWRVGRRQHAFLPGPNSGWSEAATAGAIERRIVGPIWRNQQMVTDVWIGDAADPPLTSRTDVRRAISIVTGAGLCSALLGGVVTLFSR
jgi:adenosylcobinamide-phosphate synthase